jgi:hypothetical protein
MVLLRYNMPALQVSSDDIESIDAKADGLNTYLSVVLKNGERIRCYHIKN